MGIVIGILVVVIAAAVPTIMEWRKDGSHRLDERDDWRGLRSRRVD